MPHDLRKQGWIPPHMGRYLDKRDEVLSELWWYVVVELTGYTPEWGFRPFCPSPIHHGPIPDLYNPFPRGGTSDGMTLLDPKIILTTYARK